MTKIESARKEYNDWCKAIGIESTEALNEALNAGKGIEIINLCEARQERKYAALANKIYLKRQTARIVMLAGPSSSGKTSSSLRIALQCKALGLNPKVIELDNYFVDRDKTPLDENGQLDFECLGAMDVEFLNTQLNRAACEQCSQLIIEIMHYYRNPYIIRLHICVSEEYRNADTCDYL